MLRFRSLGARITFFFVILLITVQGVLLADLDRNLLADTLHAERRNTPFPALAPVPIAWVAMGLRFTRGDRPTRGGLQPHARRHS